MTVVTSVSFGQYRGLCTRNVCLLPQPHGNAGPKPANAECLDQLTSDALPRIDCFPDGQDQIVGLAGIDHTAELSVGQRVARSVAAAAEYLNAAGRRRHTRA